MTQLDITRISLALLLALGAGAATAATELKVTSDTGAQVSIDGKVIGQTPLQTVLEEPGIHEVVIHEGSMESRSVRLRQTGTAVASRRSTGDMAGTYRLFVIRVPTRGTTRVHLDGALEGRIAAPILATGAPILGAPVVVQGPEATLGSTVAVAMPKGILIESYDR